MLRILQERKLVCDTTFKSFTASVIKPWTSFMKSQPTKLSPPSVYAGFDPTAPSLHLGNLSILMTLIRLQQGVKLYQNDDNYDSEYYEDAQIDQVVRFRPIAIVGGMTGMIGDPSGKVEDRPMISKEELQFNIQGIQKSIDSLFARIPTNNFTEEETTSLNPLVLDNSAFYEKMSIPEFFQKIGRHARISQMLAKQAVSSRLDNEVGMSYTEFSYQLFQAHDFAELFKHHNCLLQIGGSDQWGNITAGIDLIKRTNAPSTYPVDPHGFTVPLLTTKDGKKFGKSEGNAIWLNSAMTTHFDLYQYLLNVADDDCEDLLLKLTLLETKEIKNVLRKHSEHPERRIAQHTLANYLVNLIRGPDALKIAQATTELTFGQGNIVDFSVDSLRQAAKDGRIPCKHFSHAEFNSTRLVDLLVHSGLATSKSDAKRQIANGAVYCNSVKLQDHHDIDVANVTHCIATRSMLIHDEAALIRVGKRKHCLIFVN